MSAAAGAIEATASAIASGRVSAVEAVRECLRRIESLDGALGAVVALREAGALAEATALDAARHATGRPAGVLDGVPVLVKDLEDVAGMPTRRGSVLFAGARPAEADEVVPALLRRAGAVIVGKTNLPEFAIESYTDNALHGPTRNPWSLPHSPGGSSGGSAAALAAGLVPIATGTDGGGSVRIPAAACGIVGFKPTHGAVPRWPVPDWIDLSTYGPMATTVSDVRLLFSLMAGFGSGDPVSAPGPAPHPASGPGRLFVTEHTSGLDPVTAAVRTAFEAAVAQAVRLWDVPVAHLSPGEVFAGLGGDPDLDWFVLAAAEHVNALGREWVERHLDRMHPAAAEFLQGGLRVGIDDYLTVRRRRHAYTRRFDDLLGDTGLLLTPTIAIDGILADGRGVGDEVPGLLPPGVVTTVTVNITGHPAISVPAGRLASGLPFGLHLAGPRWRDELVLTAAAQWEEAYPWPRTAQGYVEFAV